MQISHTLSIKNGNYCCQACNAELGESKANWKNLASLQEFSPSDLGTPYTTGENLLLRKFSCPSCGALLDSELALPGDPFLFDIVHQPE